jgi:hypothetical protein
MLQNGNYTYAAVCVLIYVDKIKKNYVHRILKGKMYKSIKYKILRPNTCCAPLLMLCGRDL